MLDLIGVFALVVVAPLVVFAALSAVCIYMAPRIGFRRSKVASTLSFASFFKAIVAALGVAIAFPVVFTFTVGWLIGPLLGFAYVLVLAVITLAATIASFSYFLTNGVPGWQ